MNKFKKIKQSGFTLIELLIVICIIGILSTIVLTGLSNSRAKAYDAKVKMQLRGFAGAAEMYFTSQNPTTYGPATSDCGVGMFNDVDSQHGSPNLYIAPGTLPGNTTVVCGSTDGISSAYAVKATLYSGSEYWCVDSKGSSMLVSGAITGSTTICP